MAALTAATNYPKIYVMGAIRLIHVRFTSVADADTYASGQSTRIVGFWASTNGNPVTQASAGIGVTVSAGTFTLYPGEDSLGADLFILVAS